MKNSQAVKRLLPRWMFPECCRYIGKSLKYQNQRAQIPRKRDRCWLSILAIKVLNDMSVQRHLTLLHTNNMLRPSMAGLWLRHCHNIQCEFVLSGFRSCSFCSNNVYSSYIYNKKFCEELVRVRVRVTLRLAVYRQSVHLGAKSHDQYFLFFNWTLPVIALM
jgi:hypothetical protein